MTVADFFDKGGFIVYVIFLTSIVALAVAIERAIYLSRSRIDIADFLNVICRKIDTEGYDSAISHCEAQIAPIAHITKVALIKKDCSKDTLKDYIETAANQEIPYLEKNLRALATIVYISPLMGLGGTVVGMIATFKKVEEASKINHAVDPGALSEGIWTALLTTAAGLAVAIPCYVIYTWLSGKVGALVNDMEQTGSDLLEIIEKRKQREAKI